MQDTPKVVWSIPYVSVTFFPSLKQNVIAYRSSKVSSRPDCIFEIRQLWQSGFSRMHSNSYCSCWFEPEIIKINQSSHKMYSNNIENFKESTTILNVCTKRSGNLLNSPRTHTHTHTYIYIYIYTYIQTYVRTSRKGEYFKNTTSHFDHNLEATLHKKAVVQLVASFLTIPLSERNETCWALLVKFGRNYYRRSTMDSYTLIAEQ